MKIEVEYKGKIRIFIAEDVREYDEWINIGEHTEIVSEVKYKNGVLYTEETRIERKNIMFNTRYVESITRSEE